MKTQCISRLTFLNPRVLIGFALYAAGLVLAFGAMSSAAAEDNDAAELSQSVPAQKPGRWKVTGDLVTARGYSQTATLLPNGQVLVAGGTYDGLASAELYDPTTGVWTATGSMTNARRDHTATLLSNGRVLVAGGSGNPGGYLASAELYDPATGVWTATGSMATPRIGQTATLLPNGEVLVAGGDGTLGGLKSAELYDPATGVWTATGSMATTRFEHTATLLPNGQVLVAGGGWTVRGGYRASAELYDPATGLWAVTGSMATERYTHTATLLPNGRVLVAGGTRFNLATVELYDPATGVWTATGSMATPRNRQTATLLPNGQVLVAGGFRIGSNENNQYIRIAELYDPASGTWTRTDNLEPGRSGHTATLLHNGKVLVSGGYSDGDYLARADLYKSAPEALDTK